MTDPYHYIGIIPFDGWYRIVGGGGSATTGNTIISIGMIYIIPYRNHVLE